MRWGTLAPEINPEGNLRLAGDLQCDADRALRLMCGLARGLGIHDGNTVER